MPRNRLKGQNAGKRSSASSGMIASTINVKTLIAPRQRSAGRGSIAERFALSISINRSGQDHDAVHESPHMRGKNEDQTDPAGEWQEYPTNHIGRKLGDPDIGVAEIEPVNSKPAKKDAQQSSREFGFRGGILEGRRV